MTLNVVETGNPLGQAILFVHGLSQSCRSWMTQFADPQLREGFRLVALDLRDGESQGAFGAVDRCGRVTIGILPTITPYLLPNVMATDCRKDLFVASLCNERTQVALDLSEARAMLAVECSSVHRQTLWDKDRLNG